MEIMRNNKEKIYDCDCDKPNVRNSFIHSCCSDSQIIKCHGKKYLDHLKKGED